MLNNKKITFYHFLLLILLTVTSSIHAASVDFKDFRLLGKPPSYKVQARVEFDLSNYLHDALLNGVTLKARIQFRLGEHRSWWFNKDSSLLTIQYHLKYHALSRHYLLTRLDTNEHWNFISLPTALRKLSEVRNYALPKISEPLQGGNYYLFAIADMVPSSLRLPGRIQSIFSDKYSLTSEGVMWPLP